MESNFTQLTKSSLLNLGYNLTDINKATYKESHWIMPDANMFKDFETEITYKVIDNVIYVDDIHILYDGLRIKYINNSNIKNGYRFVTAKPRKQLSAYDKNKFVYEGNQINKYNKKNIALFVQAVANDYKYYMQCFEEANKNIAENQEFLINKGFTFYSETQAYKKTKMFLIEIELLENGGFQQKISEIGCKSHEDKLKLIDALIAME